MPKKIPQNTVFESSKNLNKPRSKFKRPHELSTTFNVGDIVPIYLDEVLPGDTFKIDVNKFIRLSTPIHPTMDNLYLETFWFYVPNRLVWDHWEQFCGASDKAWVDTPTYTIPKVVFDGANSLLISPGSLADYLGLPQGTVGSSKEFGVSALPFRAYGLIYNYYFRDENLEDVIPVYTGDNDVDVTVSDTLGSDYYYVTSSGTKVYFNVTNSCLKASKYHDYFTSALPGLQKGADALIPAAGSVTLQLPDQTGPGYMYPGFGTMSANGIYIPSPFGGNSFVFSNGAPGGTTGNISSKISGVISVSGAASGSTTAGLVYNPGGTLGFDNLQITINNLRNAIVAQQWMELNARSGSRYQESLFAHWGVNAGDSRLQQPEYLGGSMTLLNMGQVVQTSETNTTPLGTLSGNSVTFESNHEVFKSFVEHGLIMCLAVVRNKHTYSQGAEALWFRENIYDFYDPLWANIGEQPIYYREIFALSNNVNLEDVFGYKEAWSEYKYKPNRVSGVFSPAFTGNLASWNYADMYNSVPYLSKYWMYQGTAEVDRTLAVTSANAPQILASFSFDTETTRIMPRYNVPGLHRI